MNRKKFQEKGFALGPGFSRYLFIMVGAFASAYRYLAGSGSRNSGWTQAWIFPSKVISVTHLSL